MVMESSSNSTSSTSSHTRQDVPTPTNHEQVVPDLTNSQIEGSEKKQLTGNQDLEIEDGRQLQDKEEEERIKAGKERYNKLTWRQLTVVLVVEGIALGALSIPSVFATVGLVPGILLTGQYNDNVNQDLTFSKIEECYFVIGIGQIIIKTSLIIGATAVKYPQLKSYADFGGLLFGKIGGIIFAFMFTVQLGLITASHVLTATIMFNTLTDEAICSVAFGVIAAIILFLLALPPTFHQFAFLGYVDFVSLIAAILLVLIAAGVQSSQRPGGLSAVSWHAFPPQPVEFSKAMNSVLNIIFSYSFAACQFSFQSEMRIPTDYPKAIFSVGWIMILVYSLTGAIGYVLIGDGVASPALLSSTDGVPTLLISKIAFGIAIPLIFISGSINTQVVARFIHLELFKGTKHEYINTKKGILSWVGICAGISVFAFVVAEAIPFFNSLLGVVSSLFSSGFSFFWPSVMYYCLIRDSSTTKRSTLIFWDVINGIIFLIGVFVLGAGSYASVESIIQQYRTGSTTTPYTCTYS